MKYSAKTKPGIGDPYWYEWSVGQQYIIDMPNPDNSINGVELQANVKLGIYTVYLNSLYIVLRICPYDIVNPS